MITQTHRTALITGASRGLGLALARQLAQHGWNLIITARGAEALGAARTELAQYTQVTAITGNVAEASHRQTLAQAAQAMGGLEALVNNASILGPSPQPELLDYPVELLAQVYQINVLAPLALLQAVRAELKPEARIINLTSDAGVEAYPGWGGYGSSKAALEQLSAILAAENPHWRVYWVDPGDMRTHMHQEAFPGEDISDRPLPEESVPGLVELLESDRPSGRYQARALPEPEALPGAQELRVALTVADIDRASQLYHIGLGLPIVEKWAIGEGRGVVLAAGRATLELLNRAEAERVDQIEAGRQVAGQVRLVFEVPDVVGSSVSMQNGGAVAVNGQVQTPWGHLNQRLQTPDGLQLTLFQVTAEKEHNV